MQDNSGSIKIKELLKKSLLDVNIDYADQISAHRLKEGEYHLIIWQILVILAAS